MHMRFREIMSEGRDAPLYHAFNKPVHASMAMKNNCLLATSTQRFWADGRRRKEDWPDYQNSFWMKGVSFTRDIHYAMMWGVIVFQIDQRILTQRTKVIPFNWGYHIKDYSGEYPGIKPQNHKREREEYAVVKKTPDTYMRPEEDGGGFDTNRFQEPEGKIGPLNKMLTGIYLETEYALERYSHDDRMTEAGFGVEDFKAHPLFKGYFKFGRDADGRVLPPSWSPEEGESRRDKWVKKS